MADDNRYVRTSSGLWRIDDTVRPAPTTTTPSRGLPAAGPDRAAALVERARADVAKGNLLSAETNYRLALTFDPSNASTRSELESVVKTRDEARRAAGLRIK